MGAIGDILQIQHMYSGFGQQCRNVFYYQIDTGSGGLLDASQIAQVYSDLQTPIWVNFAFDAYTHNRVLCDNLTDGLDFAEISTDLEGSRTGEPLPPVYALNVTLPRLTKLTRNGSKRVSGLGEIDLAGGIFATGNQFVSTIVDYCPNFLSFLDYDGLGNDLFLQGVIVGRTKNIDGIYELDLSKINLHGQAILNSDPSTQRTRKG